MYELGAADVLNDTTTSHNNTSHYNFNFLYTRCCTLEQPVIIFTIIATFLIKL